MLPIVTFCNKHIVTKFPVAHSNQPVLMPSWRYISNILFLQSWPHLNNSLPVNSACATSAKSGVLLSSSQKSVEQLVSYSSSTTRIPSVFSKVMPLSVDWSELVCSMKAACVSITCLPLRSKISWNEGYKLKCSKVVWPSPFIMHVCWSGKDIFGVSNRLSIFLFLILFAIQCGQANR